MKKRIFFVLLALCLCISAASGVHAEPESLPAETSADEPVPYADGAVPSPQEVYAALIALKGDARYADGTPWDDSNHSYDWKGGPVAGNITGGTGCAAFAFELSDKAFGSLPARTLNTGEFTISDVKAGDILRVNGNTHSVIVLQVTAGGVVVAEANYHLNDSAGMVHWGRTLAKEEVEAATYLITRYPAGYIPPDDPSANVVIGSGAVGSLTWKLTQAGVLTVSGSGAMPDFGNLADRPWNTYLDQILEIRIESGVTSVGSNAFYGCKALSVSMPDGVTAIGSGAFRGSSLVSVSIPGSVQSIGDDAFRSCESLVSVSIPEGVGTIGERAFHSCTKLSSAALPASVRSVGAAAFFQCTELTGVTFAPGADTQTVSMGDDLFSGCWRLTNVTLPRSIDCISERMFQNCMYLTSLNIPQGAAGIGAEAFSSSGLCSIYIPDSVTQIGIAAFANCSNLELINYGGSESQWNSVGKIGDTATTLAGITVNYNADPPSSGEENPAPPTDPVTPENPSTPGNPLTPENPGASGNPSTPGNPGASGNPVTPGNPGASGNPAAPENSSTSGNTSSGLTVAGNSSSSRRTGSSANQRTGNASASVPAGQPYIAGEAGGSGWNVIKEKAAGASEGSQISVNMNGMSVLPGNVPDSIRGKDITIIVDVGDGIIWRINGRDVTAEHATDVNLSVQTDADAIPQEVIGAAFGEAECLQLSLASSGSFGYSAVLVVNVKSENAGLYANLFYYHPDTGEFEYICADQVAEDGIAELTFTHASEYVIVIGDAVMENYPDGLSPETGDAADGSARAEAFRSPEISGIDAVALWMGQADPQQNHSLVWLLIAAVVIAAAGAGVFFVQKRRGRNA